MVCCNVPVVAALRLITKFPAGVPVGLLLLRQAAHMRTQSTVIVRPSRARRFAATNAVSMKKAITHRNPWRPGRWKSGGAARFGPDFGAANVRAVVVMVTATVVVAVPFGVTELGFIAQVEFGGGPMQVRVSAWLKPLTGTMLSVYEAG